MARYLLHTHYMQGVMPGVVVVVVVGEARKGFKAGLESSRSLVTQLQKLHTYRVAVREDEGIIEILLRLRHPA